MKETLIVGNHPQTLVLAPHVLRLLSEERPVVLTVPIIAALLQAIPRKQFEAISITRTFRGSTTLNLVLLGALSKVLAKHDENPIETASALLASGRNVLLFPSGRVQKDVSKPEQWRSGVGRIVRQAHTRNPAINVAMLRVFDRKTAELSEPFPIQSLDILPYAVFDSYADSKEITQNLWLLYHAYFGMLVDEQS